MLKPSKFTFNNYEYSTINFFIFSLLTYFIIYDYKFYGIAFSIIILIFGFQFNTNKIENNIYKILTLVFYFKKFYLGLSTSSKTDWAKSFLVFMTINIQILTMYYIRLNAILKATIFLKVQKKYSVQQLMDMDLLFI